MADLIDRQAAIDALEDKYMSFGIFREQRAASICIDAIKQLPSAQPERRFDEWCTDCKEYDQEKHCCPRWNRVIRTTLQEVQPERKKGKWEPVPGRLGKEVVCSVCGTCYWDWLKHFRYCPNCGAEMEGEEDG